MRPPGAVLSSPWLKCIHFFFSLLDSATRSPFVLCLSSFLKDVVCSPMPYAPPVTRLSKKQAISSSVARLISGLAIGSHHLEYGFPPTHSTNCASMAPLLGAHIHDLHRAGYLSTAVFATWATFLVLSPHQLWAAGCARGCMVSWTFSPAPSSELLVIATDRDTRGRAVGRQQQLEVRHLCPAKRLTLMLTFPPSSFDCGASLPPPCQPTSVIR